MSQAAHTYVSGRSHLCLRPLTLNFQFTLVERARAAREFVDSLDDKAAARIDAFIERLRVYGNRMQGKFVKKLTDDIFELRSNNSTRFFEFYFLPAGNGDRDYVGISEED